MRESTECATESSATYETKELMSAKKHQQTISEFLTVQVRSAQVRCREYAYRALSLIAMRCYDLLGEKIVGLLLRKRTADPENRALITALLWNLVYVWADRLSLSSQLLIPEWERNARGVPETHWDLLSDLWIGCAAEGGGRDTGIRSVCFLSAARFVVAARLPDLGPCIVSTICSCPCPLPD